MALMTIPEESKLKEGFYAPRFEVLVKGVQLPQDVIRDVISLTYRDNIREIDSFEMTVANWDPVTFDYKYMGARAETRKLLDDKTSKQSQLFHLFEPCNHEVEIKLGYGGSLRTMLRGNFTTMEPSFSSSGASILTVRGLNVLHKLRVKQYTTPFQGKKPSEIASELGDKREKSKKRIPIPILIDKKAMSKEKKIDSITQKNQYDVDFLFLLARRFGYVVFEQKEDKAKGKKRGLYFGPPTTEQPGNREVTFQLERGKSIIDFKPTLTTANQIQSVTVNSYNRKTGEPIHEIVTLDKLKTKINEDLHYLLKRCDSREENVVDQPVFTKDEAIKIAEGILLERLRDMLKASVTTIGLPDLVAGKNVMIEGYGDRLDGKYFITDSTHTFTDSGYTTQISCRREDDTKKGHSGS
jgi:phage protein D